MSKGLEDMPTHIRMCIYTHIRIHTNIRVRMRRHMQTHIHIDMQKAFSLWNPYKLEV